MNTMASAIILTDGEVCPWGQHLWAMLPDGSSPTGRERGQDLCQRYWGLCEVQRLRASPRMLIHELGHALGLGHPDEAGQRRRRPL